ncbi:MAG: hypothetical protein LBM93_06650 [Oscillospiraceae bacterium]|nr:hypothetical protein [Oscillospiraceae bacterium]
MVTDTNGCLLSVKVHKANEHDTKSGVKTFEKALHKYPTLIGCRADMGYRGTFKDSWRSFTA